MDESLSELIGEFRDQHNINSFEGENGIRNLDKICRAIGYDNLKSFLADNSGAIESMVEWIGESEVDSWKESIEGVLR